jgi:aspartate oxidase
MIFESKSWKTKIDFFFFVSSFVGMKFSSGQGLCNKELVEVLVKQSRDAMEFLSWFGLQLTTLSQCGGHKVRIS